MDFLVGFIVGYLLSYLIQRASIIGKPFQQSPKIRNGLMTADQYIKLNNIEAWPKGGVGYNFEERETQILPATYSDHTVLTVEQVKGVFDFIEDLAEGRK